MIFDSAIEGGGLRDQMPLIRGALELLDLLKIFSEVLSLIVLFLSYC